MTIGVYRNRRSVLALAVGVVAAFAAGAWLGASPASAGPTSYTDRRGYAFYDLWWREARSDRETALLLHFGVPSEHPWTRPGTSKLEAGREKAEAPEEFGGLLDELGEGDLGGGGAGDGLGGAKDEFTRKQMARMEQAEGRRRSDAAPEGRVYDYSPNLEVIPLPDGAEVTPEGKFGLALKLAGESGLRVPIGEKGGGRAMEGWFKPTELPEEAVVLLASRGDGAKLLLHPDGKLELIWKAFEGDRTMRLKTEAGIEAGRWTHIAAYVFRAKHIEEFANKGRFHEVRIGVNGEVAAVHRKEREFKQGDLVRRGTFYIGMNADGGRVYRGLMDDVRVTDLRRYAPRVPMPWRDAGADREIPFGPPHFESDDRVFHASFESREMTVSQGADRLTWKLGEAASFEDMQLPGPRGKGVVVDPAFGSIRIPIKGMSATEGTLEMWWKPMNWDNHTDFSKIDWSKHLMSVARLMGRDKKTGKIVQFMELELARAAVHGEHTWIHPGEWNHFVWTWSPRDVHEQDGWGETRAGDPLGTFRAWRFGKLFYRGMLKRNNDVMNRVEPLYMDIAITDDITVYHGQRPAIAIDEVVGYDRAFTEEEKKKAYKRWTGELEE